MSHLRIMLFLLLLSFSNIESTYSNSFEPFCENSCCALCQRPFDDRILDDLTFTAEILWFKVCEDGLPIGTQVDVGPFSPFTEIHSRIKNLHPRWSEGYRLGITYLDPCDGWITDILWTHFNNHLHRTHAKTAVTEGTSLSFFVPAFGSAAFNSPSQFEIDSTSARWKLNLDILDLEIGRAFCPFPCLTFHPFIGLRAAWLRESYKIVNSTIAFTVEREVQSVRLKSYYEGLGLRMGINSLVDICCNVGVYAKAAAAIQYGNYKMKSEDFLIIGNNPGESSEMEQKDDFCACSFSSDFAIGILWHGCLCEKYALTVNLGWEQHLFIDHNHFEDFAEIFPDLPNDGQVKNPQIIRGDLCLQGFVLGATLDF